MKQFEFDTQEEFIAKLKEIVDAGVKSEFITTLTPFHVHEVDHIFKTRPSELRYFTLLGAAAGFILSFMFMVFTVMDWPIITGGKPLISIPAFIIVAFECTILFGGIVSLLGFLHLNRLPDIRRIIDPREGGNKFLIIHDMGGGK